MAFKKKIWVNVPDESNLPAIPDGQDSLARFDAENMNRIEGGIEEALSSVGEHTHSKEDVGLGNVPNVTTNDQTPTHTEATTLETLTSGEKLSVAFGKIKKAISSLISHLADTTKHITSTERTTWNGKADGSHSHIKSQITDFPTSMPASDVYSWAKQPNKPSYTPSEVGLGYIDAQDVSKEEYIKIGHDATIDKDGLSLTAGIAIGHNASARMTGVALGNSAKAMANGSIALGGGAIVNMSNYMFDTGIQFGYGENTTPGTFQVWDYPLLNYSNGLIPSERLPVRIAIGSYKGTGVYGSSNKNTIIVDFKPKLVILGGRFVFQRESLSPTYSIVGNNQTESDKIYYNWGDNSISWYNTVSAGDQYNTEGTKYSYVAFG